MAGYILLAGGAEFGGLMAKPDLRAMELAGGPDVPICILPTAAVPDHSHENVSSCGIYWFRSLGAQNVKAIPVLDRTSANDFALVSELHQARLIYLTSGFLGYLCHSLSGTACWRAILCAYEAGAVIAGSSAGAMVLCQYFFDPAVRQITRGLGLLPNICVLPHHNIFGKGWVERLTQALPYTAIVGIDERTGMVDDGQRGRRRDWSVYGQGAVTCYRHGVPIVYSAGQKIYDSFIEQA